MKNINVKYFIGALVFISFILFWVIFYFQPIEENTFYKYFRIISVVVTIDTFLFFLFTKYLWKWKIFRGWLIPFPDLNGTWKGTISSTWINPQTDSRPIQIPVILTINQSLFHISCVMRTEEMESRSFISGFSIDEEDQIKKLSYSYNSKPILEVRERSPEHFGTVVFDIVEGSDLKLKGEYWTERKTTGTIKMEFWKVEKIYDFPKTLGEHPVSRRIET